MVWCGVLRGKANDKGGADVFFGAKGEVSPEQFDRFESNGESEARALPCPHIASTMKGLEESLLIRLGNPNAVVGYLEEQIRVVLARPAEYFKALVSRF